MDVYIDIASSISSHMHLHLLSGAQLDMVMSALVS